jgi:HTH-type transcriptional regulator, competence development regulator
MSKTFGSTLKQLRRDRGMSQRQLADLVGVDFSYISKLENDRLPPPASETIARIAEKLGAPMADLHAAAHKLPDASAEGVVGHPGAQRFLELAASMQLSGTEWEALLGQLQQLRGDSGDEGGG